MGKCLKDIEHRQVRYLNSVIEASHGKLKQMIEAVRGFKMIKTAYLTIRSFEVMRGSEKARSAYST